MHRWHSVVQARLGSATQALIISEDSWNSWTRSPVVVPVVEGLRPNLLRPSVGHIGVADCTRPITLNEARLGAAIAQLSAGDSAAVRTALRAVLNVAHLLDGTRPPAAPAGVASWYPSFGHVYYDSRPLGSRTKELKMFVIVSDDRWNASQAFALGIRLTSTSKPPRLRWEVPISGGPAIVGDIRPIPTPNLMQNPPQPPRPRVCTPAQRSAIGRGLATVLNL